MRRRACAGALTSHRPDASANRQRIKPVPSQTPSGFPLMCDRRNHALMSALTRRRNRRASIRLGRRDRGGMASGVEPARPAPTDPRAEFDEAWRLFPSNRIESDFMEWRADHASPKKFDRAGRPSITKTERLRSANLLQMPRGLMCKLR